MVLEPDNFVLDWTDITGYIIREWMCPTWWYVILKKKMLITKDLQQHCNIVVCTQFVAD